MGGEGRGGKANREASGQGIISLKQKRKGKNIPAEFEVGTV